MRIVQLLFGVWVGICFLACGEKSDSFTREERERIGHSQQRAEYASVTYQYLLFLLEYRQDKVTGTTRHQPKG